MAGLVRLVPAIHVFAGNEGRKMWMPGTRQHKAGHDVERFEQ
jgi:hypothetical protein